MTSGGKIVKAEGRISSCCTALQDAYYQYQALRMRENFPACLDDLSWSEVKPLLMLIDSLIEKKCMFCYEGPLVSKDEEAKLFGGKE